jgi:autotransporter-associated beta strand protein
MKPKFTRLCSLASLATICLGSYASAQSTFDPAKDGGTWGTPVNWSNGTVPNAIDAEAIVNGAGPSGTSPATTALDVMLDNVYIVGKLTRSNSGSVAATFPTTPTAMDATKGLTLQTTSPAVPQINVLGDVFFYSAIFGNQGFEKTGTGRFTLRYNTIDQAYTGLIKISAGTLGIEKDRSLGDVNNDIEIADSARFWAEPGSNAGTVTLPASRSISLAGAASQIGSSAAAINLVIEGSISESAEGNGLVKTDAGVVTLAGTNAWTGVTTVNAGVLTGTKPEAFPGYDTQTYNVNGTSTLAVRYGDASTWNDAQVGSLTGNASFGSTASFGIDTTGNAGPATFAGEIAAPNFSKIGVGSLILSDPQSAIASLSLYGGTLQLGASGGLPAGIIFKNLIGGTTLNLGGTAASFADLQEVSGGSTTLTNGSLTYTGGTLTLSGNNGTTVDLSGLTAFTYSTSGSELKIENANNVNTCANTVLFSAGTNIITAPTKVGIGGGASTSTGPHTNTVRLGTSNTINSALLQIGGFNDAGIVNFQSGLTNPSFKLRAADGIAATILKVGETSSGSRSGAGTLDFTGGSADILATDIVVGRHIAGSDNAAVNTLTIPAGTITANTLLLSEKVNGGSPLLTAIFNQQGSTTVSINSIVMGQTSTSPSSVQNLRPTYNLEGGILTTSEIKPGTLATALAPLAQIETATAAGAISTAGNVNVTVTGTGITGSPLVIPVAVTLSDSAATWAGKVRTALSGTPAITSLYNVSGTTSSIVLTRITTGVNDGTLNIALANGTSAGVTAAPTSANTNANVISNVIRTVKLHGGTLINKTGGNLAISGATILIPGNTTAIVDSTAGQTVNFSSSTFSARINSATPSAGTLQVDGDVVLSTSALAVVDDATTDAVSIAPGTKLVLIDYQDGSLSGTFTDIADGGTVNVTKGAVTNAFVLDYNDPAYGGKAVTLTIPGADNYQSWSTANAVTGGANGDSDNDGISNVVEYALVNGGERGVLSGNTITFTKRGAPYGTDITYDIESSTQLTAGSWITLAKPPVIETTNSISYTFTPGSPLKNFARLKVTQAP